MTTISMKMMTSRSAPTKAKDNQTNVRKQAPKLPGAMPSTNKT